MIFSLFITLLLLIQTAPFVELDSVSQEKHAPFSDEDLHQNMGFRNTRSLVFTESSEGLPSTGDYNFIAFGDFNSDDDIDIAFGSGGWTFITTVGLYAYTGDGGSSWSPASSGLPTSNSWGGLELVDADSDGYLELYAPDEHWGSDTGSGLEVLEYRSDSWTDSDTHVSTPEPFGQPNNVVLDDITGNSRLDMVVCKRSGLVYYQNNGGNPVTWEEKSTGLATGREFIGVAVADINKDGLKDIIASDYSGNEYLYIQSSTGEFWTDYGASLSSGGKTYGIAVDDVNDDSHMDLVFGTNIGVLCWLGNSGGSSGTNFQWVNASSGLARKNLYSQIQLVDIDSDSDLDIIAPEGNKTSVGIEIYLGSGNSGSGMDIDWTLASATNLPSTGYWYGANCYDINDDGALDIVGASWGMGVRAWLNNINNNIEEYNLRITDDDITLSENSPIDGDEVTIYANISNLGPLDAPEFSVTFYVDDEQLESEDTFSLLRAYDEIQLEKSWLALEGIHTITVEIEVPNNVFELDTSDNSAEITVEVLEKDNGETKNNDPNNSFQFSLWLIIIFIIIIILLALFLSRRKKKKKTRFIVEPIDDEIDD